MDANEHEFERSIRTRWNKAADSPFGDSLEISIPALFTYRVEIVRLVDADTICIGVYLRPREWVKQKLRLRGLDCPELATPAGKAAKRFVEGLVGSTTAITIKTTKPDKYDRYLADVLLATGGSEIYLNNALLENGHAVRKDEWEFGDWEPEWVR